MLLSFVYSHCSLFVLEMQHSLLLPCKICNYINQTLFSIVSSFPILRAMFLILISFFLNSSVIDSCVQFSSGDFVMLVIPSCLFCLCWVLCSAPLRLVPRKKVGKKKCAGCLQKLHSLPHTLSHGLCCLQQRESRSQLLHF